MNSQRNFITIGLLIFVAAAVVTAVLKQPSKEIASDVSATSDADTSQPADALVATFFHGETRCPTCRSIESYARQAIEEGFAEELASGQIQWRAVNYETPVNAHFADDYEIYSSTVVLVRRVGGKPTDWRNLNRVWDFVDDEQAFKEYVHQETREMLTPWSWFDE